MKLKLRYLLNAAMLGTALACGLTGIVKMPELGIPFSAGAFEITSLLHDWAGLVFVALAAVHTVLNRKWFGSAWRRIRGKNAAGAEGAGRKSPALRTGVSRTSVALIFLLVLSSGSLWARGHHVSNMTIPSRIDYQGETLKDGTYYGTADGYMPGITVKVVVQGGEIESVDITDHNETMRWYLRVDNEIPDRIVDAQSTDIDAVSGATASSYGIMSAVEDALKTAR